MSDPKSIGTGKLYATTRYNLNAKCGIAHKPRYDYALITMTVGENETTSVLVKLLLFIFIELRSKYYPSKEEEQLSCKNDIICLAQELILDKNDRLSGSLRLGTKYMWAANPFNPNEFKYLFLPVEAILRPVMVIPEYSKGRFIDINRPKRTDRFYMIDRNFFDRSGWPMENLSEANDFNMEDNQANYLRENYERNEDVNVNRMSQQSNVNIVDKDILMYSDDEVSD